MAIFTDHDYDPDDDDIWGEDEAFDYYQDEYEDTDL